MTGHTIVIGTRHTRELWDRNPRCTCAHTWRSHSTSWSGRRCGVTRCRCEVFVDAARSAEGSGEGES